MNPLAFGKLPPYRPRRFVPLEIEMQVCVGAYYLRSHVREELLQIFSNGYRRDGRAALFHPDVAALRRYLVDSHFMRRDRGIYRRS